MSDAGDYARAAVKNILDAEQLGRKPGIIPSREDFMVKCLADAQIQLLEAAKACHEWAEHIRGTLREA